MHARFRWLALCWLLPLLLLACQATTAPAPALRFGVVSSWPGFTPFFLAGQRQLYSPTQVDLISFSSLYDAYRAFSQRRADIVATTLFDAIRLADEGVPLKIVMVIDYSNGADGIVARQDIRAIGDLKGKRIGVTLGDSNHFILLAALDRAGLREQDVQLVNGSVEESAQAFAQGKVDAAILWDPLLSEQASAPGAHKIFTTSEIPGEIPDVLVVQQDLVEQRPADVAQIMLGWDNALRAWKTQGAEAEQIMARVLNVPPADFAASISGIALVDREHNRRLFDTADRPSIWTTYVATVNFMTTHRLLAHPAPSAQALIDPQFLNTAVQP